jgi:hypothetical protein
VAHVALGAPPVRHSAPASPAVGAGSSQAPLGTATPVWSPPSSATASPSQYAAECQAYFKNPWKPGAQSGDKSGGQSWDQADFGKLSAAAGGPQYVLVFCVKYLPPNAGHGKKPGDGYPSRYPGGKFVMPPADSNGQGQNQGGGNGSGSGSGHLHGD